MSLWHRGLQLTNGADRGKIDVVANEVFIGRKRHRFTDVSFTVDLTQNGALGLDTGAEAVSTHYDLVLAAREDGDDITGLFVVSGNTPVLPDHYGSYERASTHINDSAGDLVLFKNSLGSDWFRWDEDEVGHALLEVLNVTTSATVAAPGTIDCSPAAPRTASELRIVAINSSGANSVKTLWIRSFDQSNLTDPRFIEGKDTSLSQMGNIECDSQQRIVYWALHSSHDTIVRVVAYKDIR